MVEDKSHFQDSIMSNHLFGFGHSACDICNEQSAGANLAILATFKRS